MDTMTRCLAVDDHPTVRQGLGLMFGQAPDLDLVGSVEYNTLAVSLFNTGDLPTIQKIIQQYNVSYIVVGSLERVHALPDALNQFEAMVTNGQLERAFVSGDDILYKVVRPAASSGD